MIGGFFVDRPVFASVISLLIVLAGALALFQLPVAQYPQITPPQVLVTATYPGASAQTVEQAVTAPVEKEMNGVKNLLYMSSTSSNTGESVLTLTFESGTDVELAAVEVQNRLKKVENILPQEVLRLGIRVEKASPMILLMVTLRSTDPRFDEAYLNNFAATNVVDELKRLPGAGDIVLYGFAYSMRLWVQPDRLADLGLTVTDLIQAVREQNSDFATGQIGQQPTAGGQQLTVPVVTKGRLTEQAEFEQIILRSKQDGSMIQLKDVARVELGSQDYTFKARLNGTPTAAIGVNLRAGANALNLAKAVKERMADLAKGFPQGIAYSIPYDTTTFVKVSIELVVHTFFEALALVLLVVFLFLGSWRATLIPMTAVPVSIVGTFAGMQLLGYSINQLTLFGLVLAIGIVVDDAIVVVERVEEIMRSQGLSPREATKQAMVEIAPAVIGVTLVIASVFVPVAFLGGTVGTLYQQFAVTITISVLLSALTALTLTPALCGMLLQPHGAESGHRGLLARFNVWFEGLTHRYTGLVQVALRRALVLSVLYLALIGGVLWLFRTVPGGFVPDEDQGYLMVAVELPAGAAQSRTLEVVERIEQYFKKHKDVADIVSVAGYGLFYSGPNVGTLFVTLKDWKERPAIEQNALMIALRAYESFTSITEATVYPIPPPSIPGLGQVSGFDYRLQDRTGDRERLAKAAEQFTAAAAKHPDLAEVRPTSAPETPLLYVDLDRIKAKAMGIPIQDLFYTVGGLLGSYYVNDFAKFGRVLQVRLQSDADRRMKPEDIARFYVRNQANEMVPLSAVANIQWIRGPIALDRYNGYPAVNYTGAAAPGKSSGQAIAAMQQLSAELPTGMSYEWSGQSYQEIKAGQQAPYIFALSMVVVFLFLAALYESWAVPFAVMLVVPLGVLGALLATWLLGMLIPGMTNDVYFQIGLIALIGLAAKNAILIVEFAKQRYDGGRSPADAALEAARLRFRPIVMTSLAFILGVVPLVLSTGAGASARRAIGTGVFGGMISATALAVVFVPLFYVLVMKLAQRGAPSRTTTGAGDATVGGDGVVTGGSIAPPRPAAPAVPPAPAGKAPS
jgi:hydrophobe/amphiphile efflux-1 (HAE1) family protein